MTEFIIVGRGLAATTLMHTFYSHGISFKVVGDADLSSSSKVAAGIWNQLYLNALLKVGSPTSSFLISISFIKPVKSGSIKNHHATPDHKTFYRRARENTLEKKIRRRVGIIS